VLITAFGDVLRRWSGQRASTLDLTLFDRPPTHPRADSIVGDSTSPTVPAVEAEPGDGALINVAATRPTAGGYLTVYPDGATRPAASNLNFSAGQTVPNLVGASFGTNGVDFYNGSAGHVDVVIDPEGYFIQPLP
jgi:hypothetical protein